MNIMGCSIASQYIHDAFPHEFLLATLLVYADGFSKNACEMIISYQYLINHKQCLKPCNIRYTQKLQLWHSGDMLLGQD